jgi:hypothetical protein
VQGRAPPIQPVRGHVFSMQAWPKSTGIIVRADKHFEIVLLRIAGTNTAKYTTYRIRVSNISRLIRNMQ